MRLCNLSKADFENKINRWKSTKTKECSNCNQTKPFSEFHKDKHTTIGLSSRCRECASTIKKKYMDSEKYKNQNLKKYGITYSEFVNLWKHQNKKCVICNKPLKIKGLDTHVDHCHTTGKVRGLLCSNCNTFLGLAKEKKWILMNAINYLEATK